MIKYKYALDAGRPVHIDSLIGGKDRKDYTCPGCGKVLRPILGEIRKKHFRHKIEEVCSLETYLHNLGKSILKTSYDKALSEGTAFHIEYFAPLICNYCKNGTCEVKKELNTFDLTSKFKKISLEKSDGEFVPDLLLETDTGEKIYIEIAVSHYCSSKKQKSGIRIVEIEIKDEADLEQMLLL